VSVIATWAEALSLQQQTVLVLAGRGPDGAGKHHKCKPVIYAYRATVFKSARLGREMQDHEFAPSFMDHRWLTSAYAQEWKTACQDFLTSCEELPHHYVLHFTHAVEIVGYKHPDEDVGNKWFQLYCALVNDMHFNIETREQMDKRLGDWDRRFWEEVK